MKTSDKDSVATNTTAAAYDSPENSASIKPPPYGLTVPFPFSDKALKDPSSTKKKGVPLSDELKVSNEHAQNNGIAPDLSNIEQQKISQVTIGSIYQRLAIVNREIRKCHMTVYRQVAANGPTGGGGTSKGDGANLANTYITREKLRKYKAQLLRDLEIAKKAGQTH